MGGREGMSERLEEIKGDWEAERCIKPENVEFLIGQSERAETLEMKYENSGSMFNRQNMQARIDELEHQNQKYREADEGEFLDNLIGRLYEYENQIIRYSLALDYYANQFNRMNIEVPTMMDGEREMVTRETLIFDDSGRKARGALEEPE